MRRENPRMSLKDIAIQLGVDYGYVRNVHSRFVKAQVTAKGQASEPLLPFRVQGWYWWNAVPASWYGDCPVPVSDNRNGQRRFQGSSFSFIIHKNGDCFINPLFGGVGWKEEFEAWLRTWRAPDVAKLFMESLQEVGRKEYAFFTPGVPKNYKVTVKGVGTFSTDTTPYPDGTTEWRFDAGFQRSIEEAREIANMALSVASESTKSLGETNKAIGKFSEQLNLHYDVLNSMRDTLGKISGTIDTLGTPWVVRKLRKK